jgi:hypothetical protein
MNEEYKTEQIKKMLRKLKLNFLFHYQCSPYGNFKV